MNEKYAFLTGARYAPPVGIDFTAPTDKVRTHIIEEMQYTREQFQPLFDYCAAIVKKENFAALAEEKKKELLKFHIDKDQMK